MAEETTALTNPTLEVERNQCDACLLGTIDTLGEKRVAPLFVGFFFMLIASILMIVNYEGGGLTWGRYGGGDDVDTEVGGIFCGAFMGVGFLICLCSVLCPCCRSDFQE